MHGGFITWFTYAAAALLCYFFFRILSAILLIVVTLLASSFARNETNNEGLTPHLPRCLYTVLYYN
jgi:hypothetical protein